MVPGIGCQTRSAEIRAQRLPPVRRIDAKGKELASSILSRPGTLDGHRWIEAKRDQILPTVELVAVAPVSAAGGRNEKMEAAAKAHPASIANEGASGMASVDEGVGAGY